MKVEDTFRRKEEDNNTKSTTIERENRREIDAIKNKK